MLFFSHNFFVVFLLITAIYGPILLLYVFWSFFKTELSYFHSPEYFVGLLSGQVHIGNLDNALYTSPSQQLFHWYIIGWIFFNQTMWNSLLTTAQSNRFHVINSFKGGSYCCTDCRLLTSKERCFLGDCLHYRIK